MDIDPSIILSDLSDHYPCLLTILQQFLLYCLSLYCTCSLLCYLAPQNLLYNMLLNEPVDLGFNDPLEDRCGLY